MMAHAHMTEHLTQADVTEHLTQVDHLAKVVAASASGWIERESSLLENYWSESTESSR